MERLRTATAFEIETNYQLYRDMIAIMTKVDGVAPVGACCGRNKAEHCRQFTENRNKYYNIMDKIQERTIIPRVKGKLVQVTIGEYKTYLLDMCSDEEILHLIEIGAVQKEEFDFKNYQPKEEKKAEETTEKPKKAKKKK